MAAVCQISGLSVTVRVWLSVPFSTLFTGSVCQSDSQPVWQSVSLTVSQSGCQSDSHYSLAVSVLWTVYSPLHSPISTAALRRLASSYTALLRLVGERPVQWTVYTVHRETLLYTARQYYRTVLVDSGSFLTPAGRYTLPMTGAKCGRIYLLWVQNQMLSSPR